MTMSQSLHELDKTKNLGVVSWEWTAVLIVTILVVLGLLGFLANSFLLLSIVAGSVGGIIHDLIQNKGILIYPATTDEGVYLGWFLGIVLGGAAGFIAYASILTPTIVDPKVLVAPLTAGVGLKGLIDGATNTSVADLEPKKHPTKQVKGS